MIEDIQLECSKEIIWSKFVEKAIGGRTVQLFKEYLLEKQNEPKYEGLD